MSNSEVYELALSWMNKCKCVDGGIKSRPAHYPTRLLDLSALKMLGYIDPEKWEYYGGSGLHGLLNTKIKLIETSKMDWSEAKRNFHYVTLSHKWGGNAKHIKLTRDTKQDFEEGLSLETLPRTFQDAIIFATRLHNVRYIWIDSLCIMQGDKDDWLQESGLMDKVYRNSFLNISATAGDNSDEGLYSPREPHRLWEDLVSLNVDGLQKDPSQPADSLETQKVQIDGGDDKPIMYDLVNGFATIRTCLLLDVSNWEELVNQAPVNKRGWVVQERLVAPRVLHFCKGRIAWECSEFDEIEGRAPGLPNFQLIGDEIYEAVPMKGLNPDVHGKKLRQNRLRGIRKPPTELLGHTRTFLSLELWARIVEMYSKTDLTEEKDKLVALSGIASQMATVIGSEQEPAEYIAGMWRTRNDTHLLSQLLWKVEPVYCGDSDTETSIFVHASTRPKHYRAPSFSWASIDAQAGSGITHGEVVDDRDTFVTIPPDDKSEEAGPQEQKRLKNVWIDMPTDNKFGLVGDRGGHIILRGCICKVVLSKERSGFLYSWCLQERHEARTKRGPDKQSLNIKVDVEHHLNVHLDCPTHDDRDGRLTGSDSIYCLPVALWPPNALEESQDLICLLLEQSQSDSGGLRLGHERPFRRIGVTKLTPSFDSATRKYMVERRYDETAKKLICII